MVKRITAGILMFFVAFTFLAEEMKIAENGIANVPVIAAESVSPDTLKSANHLVEYLQKVSGAKVELIQKNPDKIPESAIWVGFQPQLKTIFPNVDFDFQHPEEIMIICNGKHLAILGRDKIVGDNQIEYGTANAVYTFLQKYLDVRWFIPGPLGEDIIKRKTIIFQPFEYRYHPQFLQRDVYRKFFKNADWSLFQRIKLDSLNFPPGHGFYDWWDKYAKEHPDYFALQPNGKRDGFPAPKTAKLCDSNPKAWEQFWQNVNEEIKNDPSKNIFNASPNDSSSSGYCICEKCSSWDPADAPKCELMWQGLTKEHAALADRYAKFWNILARGLKERYPDKELWIYGMAYGSALKAPPVKEVLDKNVAIGFVGTFPITSERLRSEYRDLFAQWKGKAQALIYRPNMFYYSGGMAGLPCVAIKNTIEDFRFLAENNCVGLIIDMTPQHWATQAPQYYVMAQMAWDPYQDGKLLLDDYYKRFFGKASVPMREYWNLMDETHAKIVETPVWKHGMGTIRPITAEFIKIYDADFVRKADVLLKKAAADLAGEPEIYKKRIEFFRTGLEFVRLQIEIFALMKEARENGNQEAFKKAAILCVERKKLLKMYEGIAFDEHLHNETWTKGRKMNPYMGPVGDQLPGSPSELKFSDIFKDPKKPVIRKDVD